MSRGRAASALIVLCLLAGGCGSGANGAVYVFGDDDDAEEQLRACRGSGGLLCFRASNVVVVLEEGGLAAQRLALAIRRLSR